MKKFFQSKGFIISALVTLCIVILGVCWFASRDKPGNFTPDESPPSTSTSDWSDGGSAKDGKTNGADAYTPGQSSPTKEEYPKVSSETEDEVIIDFTDTDKPTETPPIPEGKSEIKDPGDEHPVNPAPDVTPPPVDPPKPTGPAPGDSNGNGAVYDPVFGWVVPGQGQPSVGDSDGDLNKQVGNMGGD